jgi:hypothetical protein
MVFSLYVRPGGRVCGTHRRARLRVFRRAGYLNLTSAAQWKKRDASGSWLARQVELRVSLVMKNVVVVNRCVPNYNQIAATTLNARTFLLLLWQLPGIILLSIHHERLSGLLRSSVGITARGWCYPGTA